jgi:hypothetical protein
MTAVLVVAAEVLLVACALLGWLFVILYSRVRWYVTPEGRHLMKFTTALALTFSLSVLFQLIHPTLPTRAVLSVVLFGWIAWELGNRVRLHLRAKREGRDIPTIPRRLP